MWQTPTTMTQPKRSIHGPDSWKGKQRHIIFFLALLWFCKFHNVHMWEIPLAVPFLPQPFTPGLCVPDTFTPWNQKVTMCLISYRAVSRTVWRPCFSTIYFFYFTKRDLTEKIIVQASRYWVRVTHMHTYFSFKIEGMLPFFPCFLSSLNNTTWFLRQGLGT